MFSTLRTRFGIPGVISVIALVFAMFGGAYAASNSSGGGKATASAKAKKGPRGPKGAKGDTGPAGPTGAQGPAGAKGDAGAAGSNGSNGASATTETFSGSAHGCTAGAGGVAIKSASPEVAVCNGKNGTNGTNGTTGFTEMLPPGKTETGAWAFGDLTAASAPGSRFYRVPISFSIPLGSQIPQANVHYINPEGKEVEGLGEPVAGTASTVCTGSATAPTAAEGHLCIYQGSLEHGVIGQSSIQALGADATGGASVAGAYLMVWKTEEEARGWGGWAVTAE